MLKLQDRPVAERYARALFAVARGKNIVEPTREQLVALVQTMLSSPALAESLRHPRLPLLAKVALVSDVVGGLSEGVKSLVALLLEKKRWDALIEIARSFDLLADEAGGVFRVRATSPFPWDTEARETLRRRLEKARGSSVRLELRTDPSLLGGLVLQSGDRVWDNSLRSQLDRLRDMWGAGGSV